MNRSHGFAAILALAAALVAFPAAAAPTCQTASGETIKCGISGAMPVGWRLGAEQNRDRPYTGKTELFKWLQAVCAVGILFSIMAAMPDFDSTHPGGWDSQEDDPADSINS